MTDNLKIISSLTNKCMNLRMERSQLRADRDYWKAEALKHCAKLGEIKLLAGRKEK